MSGEGIPRFSHLSLWVFLSIVLVGCSTGHGSAPPTVPTIAESGLASPDGLAGAAADYNRYLWSYHLIWVDPSTNEFEVIPVREALAHWNVLRFLEQGPCYNCVKVLSITNSDHGTKLVDVEIRHPFPTLNLTGFDVRGIAMFTGSHVFPVSGLNMPDRTLGDGELINADGFTSLYHSGTEHHDPTGCQSYVKGRFATNQAPDAKLNGYKRFITADPSNTRNAFYAGTSITVTYDIDMPDTQFIFGYAVDACWAPPISKPVDDPMTDFGPEANCPEAWKIEITDAPIGNGLTDCGGQTALSIYVYDWQGKDDAHPVLVECPELFDGEVEATWKEDGAGFTTYEATVENSKIAPAGTYRCLVGKEAQENDPAKPWLDITAYRIHELVVVAETFQPPTAVAEASQLSAYVGDTIHFDASGSHDNDCGGQSIVKYEWDWENDGTYDEEGVEVDHSWSTAGIYHVQLRVTDDEGVSDVLDEPLEIVISSFLWARTWGGSGEDDGWAVAVDGSGNAYVTGSFWDVVDFDPGSGIDEHTSNGWYDVFLSKFDSLGNLEWAKTWGGPYDHDSGLAVAVDSSDNVYVAGCFRSTVDFDPGPGVDDHTANGQADAFLSKFDSGGDFQWARTWGGSDPDLLDQAQALVVDEPGDVCVTGSFAGTTDFDPGPGEDWHDSNPDGYDIFLSKFHPTGDFLWARTWGGNWDDVPGGVAADGSGDVYVAGTFPGTVDFDPGPGVDNHTSNGLLDVFLSKFDSSGSFQWARTWGGPDQQLNRAVAADGLGNVYVMGWFEGTADFDPGPGVDSHVSNGYLDTSLSRFDSSGAFWWAETWGGSENDQGWGVAADGSGGVYVTGDFYGTVDLDPGPDVDNHASNGIHDAFLNKFDSSGAYRWTETWGGSFEDRGIGVALYESSTVYVTGTFCYTVDFDTGPGVDNHTSNGYYDAFLSKFGP